MVPGPRSLTDLNFHLPAGGPETQTLPVQVLIRVSKQFNGLFIRFIKLSVSYDYYLVFFERGEFLLHLVRMATSGVSGQVIYSLPAGGQSQIHVSQIHGNGLMATNLMISGEEFDLPQSTSPAQLSRSGMISSDQRREFREQVQRRVGLKFSG